MKHDALLAFAVAALAACDTAPTAPAANRDRPSFSAVTSNTNITIPIDLFMFVPCANGGGGGLLGVSGALHLVSPLPIINSGNVVLFSPFPPPGISGFCFVSGGKDQGAGGPGVLNNFR